MTQRTTGSHIAGNELFAYRRSALLWSAVIGATVLAACGGGGGGGSSTSIVPTGTPTPAAAVTQSAASSCSPGTSIQSLLRTPRSLSTAPVTDTTFTVDSNPHGLPVTMNGQAMGTTPTSTVPIPSSTAYVATITDGSASASYCFSQIGGASKTIYYNAVSDTSGSMGTISTSSITGRIAQSASAAAPGEMHRHALGHAPGQGFATDRLLVKYRSGGISGGRSILSIEQSAGASQAETLGPAGGSIISRVVHVAPGVGLATLQQHLRSDSSVAEVDRVQLRYPFSIVSPNDPVFAGNDQKQWDLYEISAPAAWGITEGSSSIAIAVIDTGYDVTAPDLKTKVTYAESSVNGVVSSTAGAAADQDGHGTNVSGIAAADTNNGIAVAGTGFNTALQEYRIFSYSSSGESNATTTDEAQAIYDAVSHGAKVISLSLGGTQGDSGGIDAAEYDAVEYAISQNVVVVAAAGNEYATSVDYPAAYPGVIAVGASALNDSAVPNSRVSAVEYVPLYSNSGPGLALVAPGGDPSSSQDSDYLHWIENLDTSTPSDPSNTCSVPTACLAQFAGTSQATPHVSAAAALMLALNPNLTPAQIRSVLMSTADNIKDARQGAGRLNLYRALAAVSGSVAIAPQYQNFRAFAYSNSGGTTPAILDVTYTQGVQVGSGGAFRISDLPANAANYRIAVWADLNGDGIVDAGDYFGVSGVCTGTSACASASGIIAGPVASGFTLP